MVLRPHPRKKHHLPPNHSLEPLEPRQLLSAVTFPTYIPECINFSFPDAPVPSATRTQPGPVGIGTGTLTINAFSSPAPTSSQIDPTAGKLIIEGTQNHADSLATLKNQSVSGDSTGPRLVVVDNSLQNPATSSDSILVLSTFPGDTSLDAKVTIADLNVIAGHWQPSVQNWSTGDFTTDSSTDGKVTISDLNILASHWQTGGTFQAFLQPLANSSTGTNQL